MVPTRSDPTLSRMTEGIGGPLGRHAEPGVVPPRFFTVERVLVLLVGLSAVLAVLFKDHCRQVGWLTPDQFSTTCASDIVAAGPGTDTPLAPLTSLLAALTGWLSGAQPADAAGTLRFFDLNAGLIVVAWLLGVLALARSNRLRPWDAAVFAASPLLLFSAYASWDLWVAALIGIGLFLFSRRTFFDAGLVLGVAGAMHPVAALTVTAAVVLAVRRARESRASYGLGAGRLEAGPALAVGPLLVGGVLSWLAITVASFVLFPTRWLAYWVVPWTDPPAEGSLYGAVNALVAKLGVEAFSGSDALVVSAALLIIGLVGLLLIAARTPLPPRLAALAFVLTAWALLVDKHAGPQQAVWLLPLLALARPRWKTVLCWQALALAYYLAYLLHLGVIRGDNNTQHGIDGPYYALVVLSFDLGTLVLIVLVCREMFQPWRDQIRRGGVDDPLMAPEQLVAQGPAPLS
ncbi:hypothetical protein [Psychromicrobium xiongbiense]|uniref:hypothetical protein n=1 Tax=Psychromicrobium xiongbiense TaxID=3051184 RepID=UPI00255392F2|nr:hypothetical protein [Psychromicrobium sp. YIM S02556]